MDSECAIVLSESEARELRMLLYDLVELCARTRGRQSYVLQEKAEEAAGLLGLRLLDLEEMKLCAESPPQEPTQEPVADVPGYWQPFQQWCC
jgi:hypothetical protein